MAMLEAFVYDPLISWRLLAQTDENIASKVSPQRGNRDFVNQIKSSSVPLENNEDELHIELNEDIPDESGPHKLVRVSTTTIQFEEEVEANYFENPRYNNTTCTVMYSISILHNSLSI
jgi:hypothetical protein